MGLLFHIDFNFAKYRLEYLESFLPKLREYGYEKILWEIEDAVRFDTAPEVAAPDAVSKTEFRKLLEFASRLGFENLPLLQTVSHNAYVLRQKKFYSLSEQPEFVELYCLTKTEVKSFLLRWISEYLELFPNVRAFHLGADEAWALGRFCKRCRKAIAEKGEGSLMANHLKPLTDFLLGRSIIPIIWADMPLKYPSMAECLDRRIIMADWNYGSGNDCGTKTEANAFNGAAKFREMGFRVWGCGAGRSYGDSVFAPRYDFHCDNFERWLSLETEGITESTLFTSWSVHLFPFSLQEPIFARAKFRNLTRDAFEKKYACDHYGKDGTRFFDAVRLLSIPAPLSQIVELGYNQTNQKAPLNALENTLAQTTILPEKIKDLLRNYDEAAEIFRKIPGADDWLFAARHLIFRAKLALLLSGNSSARLRGEVESELDELEALTRKAFNERLLPVSAALAVDNLFPQVKEVIRKHFEILWKT